MAIKYIGRDIIHEYKGVSIEKVERYYSQGTERYYRVGDKMFEKLREAKQYIDKQKGAKNDQ